MSPSGELAMFQAIGGAVAGLLDGPRHRLAEVAERLDFTQPLLTQDVSANQLPRGAQ